MTTVYASLSEDRKNLQKNQELPGWMTTAAYSMLMQKYVMPGETIKQMYQRIARETGMWATHLYGNIRNWEEDFFDIMWRGWLSPSTPILANMGTSRALSVSCQGSYISDSIYGFYSSRLETAVLTKNGFGTSAYFGDIRQRGEVYGVDGRANGILPVLKGFVQDMRDVSQSSIRRGAFAGYVPINHGDFFEIADYLFNNPDDLNIGWNIPQTFINDLNSGESEAISRYQKILSIRKVTGKGYLNFIDKMNEQSPQAIKNSGITIKASNLCTEIALPSDEDHSFTCVLSSLNVANYDEWKNTDTVFLSQIFLDAVIESFLDKTKGQAGFENVVRFTEKSRAVGLGVLGFHTYLQKKSIPLESFQASVFNNLLFKEIKDKSDQANMWMAQISGEPEWCAGLNMRHATLMAIAPNMSTALICGGVSQGIEPLVANAFNQNSSAGEIMRFNPVLMGLMKDRNIWDEKHKWEVIEAVGSVQKVDWLSQDEKMVFRTAFETDQMVLLRLASSRQKYIDQAQSLNLFFAADEDPKYISQVHKEAFMDPRIKSLYYMRSQSGVIPNRDTYDGNCEACEG